MWSIDERSRFCWLGLLAATALTLSVGCSSNATSADAAAAAPKPAEAAIQQPPPPDYIASGPIVVENQIELAAQRDGLVAEVFVETGAPVKKGQLLARLDDRQLSADRDAAAAKARSTDADLKNWEASAKVAQSQRDRAEQLWAANVIAKSEEEKAKYQYDATEFEVQRQREDLKYAQASLRSLELEVEKTKINAPFDGVVARRYIRPGQEVTRNDRLFWVSAVAPLRIKFSLPESDLGRVRKGTELVVTTASTPGESHPAKVVLVGPVVDPASDTIDVTAELQGPSSGLRPGMTANIRLRKPQ
ncbi:MAG: efflux RND transporter periplasmic adaptor subunit [Candidatus Sulfotelmatobacter sp.]|jgi:RND family efflux transporter MFP subunit